MFRLLTLATALALTTGFCPAALPQSPVVAASACAPLPVVMQGGFRDRFRKKKGSAEDDMEPGDVYGDIDIDEAAAAIKDVKSKASKPKAEAEPIKVPEIDVPDIKMPEIDAEKAEEVLVETVKLGKVGIEKSKELIAKAIEFEQENDVSTKAKDAFSAAVEFWKENEIGLKARAIFEVAVKEAEPLLDEVKKMDVPSAKKGKTTATAKPSKKEKIPKQWASKSKAKGGGFEMPKIEMPKFK